MASKQGWLSRRKLQTSLPVFDIEDGAIVAHKRLKNTGNSVVYQGTCYVSKRKSRAVKDQNTDSTTHVAIKVFSHWDEDQYREEANILTQLPKGHPNVIDLLYVVSRPQPALVTPLITAGDLYDYLGLHGALRNIHHINDILHGIGQGLAHLHSHGIVHRDLKSANILLERISSDGGDDFRPIIIDFGWAKRLPQYADDDDPDTPRQCSQFATATLMWRPPEMILHQHYSYKTDVYGLGVMAWELFTGRFPYEGHTEQWVLDFVAQQRGRPDQVLIFTDDPAADENGLFPRSTYAVITSPMHNSLVQDLWHQDPARRPTVLQFLSKLWWIRLATDDNDDSNTMHGSWSSLSDGESCSGLEQIHSYSEEEEGSSFSSEDDDHKDGSFSDEEYIPDDTEEEDSDY